MKAKGLWMALMALMMCFVSNEAYAYDIEVENADGVTIYYSYINEEKELAVAYGTYSGSVVIPEEVTFMNRTRKVTSIGYRAFYNCSGLTSVTIPNSVMSIGREAFSYCSGLNSVTIGNSVTSIGNNAFRGCSGLTSVTIPNSVTSIGDDAFHSCSGLTSVTIPNSVSSIGVGAFSGCSGLTSVHITDLAAWCKITFGYNPLYYAHHLYLNNEEITDLVIPESVTSIRNYAFQNCSGLTSVTIPNSVTSIGERAFDGCSSLTSVTIPNSVTSIGYYAFSGCSGLTSVTIGNSVSRIGTEAFEGCRLENVMALNSKTEFQQSFSVRTYQHAMLYIQEGTWGEAVYDGGWYQFNNIREIAMNTAKLSSSQAYTLMDTKSFGYAVYDETNGKVKMVKAFYSVDEQDLNNCWQLRMQAGRRYLYNLGARKYAIVTPDGQIAFADSETEMALTDGENGVMMGADGSHQWGFVKNKNIPVETDITTLSSDTEKKVPIHIFSPDGKRSATPQRGINIVDGKKVVVR